MKITTAIREQVAALSAKGMNQRQVADELKVSRSFVGSVLKKAAVAVVSPVEANSLPPVEDSEMISKDDANAFLEGLEDPAPKPSPGAVADDRHAAIVSQTIEEIMNLPEPKQSSEPRRKAPKSQRNIFVESADADADDETAGLRGDVVAAIISECEIYAPLLKSFLQPTPQAFISGLSKRGLAELQALHAAIKRTRTSGNLANSMKHGVIIGAGLIETGGRYAGLYTAGYREAILAQQTEVAMILREIANDHPDWGKSQKPEYRLAMVMAGTLLAVDGKNRLNAINEHKTVAPEVSQKFSDLDGEPPAQPQAQSQAQPKDDLPRCPVSATPMTSANSVTVQIKTL